MSRTALRNGRPRTDVLRSVRRGERLLVTPEELVSGRTLALERRAWLTAASRVGVRVATAITGDVLEIQVTGRHREPRQPRGKRGQSRNAVPLSEGGRVIQFIETHCRFTKGRWIGRPFHLQNWQRALLWRLFELRPDGRRRYRWALIGMPKKNGKTELSAALALYFLIADREPAPLIQCAAASDDQADLVFGAAKQMCELSPTLRAITERYRSSILVPDRPGAELQRISAKAGTKDGPSVHVAILDELHEWQPGRGEDLWNVITNGTGAREEPMIVQITTAGYDQETVCYRQYEYGRRVESGEIDDPAYYFEWHSVPDDLPHDDPQTWALANPSYGVTVREEFYRDQLSKKPEAVFRRYFLNQWTAVEAAWLPHGVWAACATDAPLTDDAETLVGIDASTRHDSTAVVVVQRHGDRRRVRCRIWERPLDPRSGRPIAGWKLPIEALKDHIRGLAQQYQVEAIGYDPAFITWVADELETEGLPMVEIPQTAARMVPASQRLYELIIQGLLEHDGDPAMARHVANTEAKESPTGGWRLVKGKARQPMDAAIALAFCCHLDLDVTVDAPPQPFHVY